MVFADFNHKIITNRCWHSLSDNWEPACLFRSSSLSYITYKNFQQTARHFLPINWLPWIPAAIKIRFSCHHSFGSLVDDLSHKFYSHLQWHRASISCPSQNQIPVWAQRLHLKITTLFFSQALLHVRVLHVSLVLMPVARLFD